MQLLHLKTKIANRRKDLSPPLPVGLLFKRCRSFLFNNGGLLNFPPMSLLHNHLFFISMIIKFFLRDNFRNFFFNFFY
nr:MAG TPA: hypothetical protein [Caudoviricetes sp.]